VILDEDQRERPSTSSQRITLEAEDATCRSGASNARVS
jgi:hypothetical protein